MTPDEMISHVSSLLGKVGTVIDAEILVDLKLAQIEAERGPLLPWRLIKEKYTTLTVDEHRVAIPVDFLREAEPSALYYIDADAKAHELTKKTNDSLRNIYEVTDTGTPTAYALLGGYFWIYPKPDSTYRIQMNYYAKDEVLAVAGAENIWGEIYPDLLMGLAGLRATQHMARPEVEARFGTMVTKAREQMVIDETAREMQNMEAEFGEE